MKLRLGMIGGGQGAFIGGIHRMAAALDGLYELTAGAFSSDAEKSRATGVLLGLAPDRVYGSYEELITQEKQRPEAERVQVISIVTPNHLHFAPAKMALENGFHVILDKPMTFSLAEAKQLKEIAAASGRKLCLTHTYTGYPMVKEARQLIAADTFGPIRKAYVEYPQGWLSAFEEGTDNKQAAWRTDPARSGIAGAMGDIGTHAFNLLEYVTGLQVERLCADINTVVPGRRLDDDGAVLLRLTGGASGVLVATQVAAGEENNVRIRAYGDKGGLEWQQVDANTLQVKWLDKPTRNLAGRHRLRRLLRAAQRPHARRPPRRLPRSLRQPLPQLRPDPAGGNGRPNAYAAKPSITRAGRGRPGHGVYRKCHCLGPI